MAQFKSNLDETLSLISVEGKHVAMLTRWFSCEGGLELYCHKLVEELLDRGVRVSVVCEENKSDFSHENLAVIDYGPPFKKLSKGDAYRYAFRKTRETLERLENVDLVHSQQLPSPRHEVVTFHNHTVNRLSNTGRSLERVVNRAKSSFTDRYQTKMLFDRRLASEANCRIFVSSTEQEEYYREFNLDQSSPYVIAYPGATTGREVETTDGEPRDFDEYERVSRFPFLFVGKGYRMKGLDVLFKACRLLKSYGAEFELNVVGLEKKPILAAALMRYKIEDRVNFLGYVFDVSRVFDRCYAIVTPSRLESFGMAPLQAMRHGLVPIVSRVSGIAEILESGVNGLILENHLDEGELAFQMKRLIDEPDLLSAMSSRARERACDFTWEKTADATIFAYQHVIHSKLNV